MSEITHKIDPFEYILNTDGEVITLEVYHVFIDEVVLTETINHSDIFPERRGEEHEYINSANECISTPWSEDDYIIIEIRQLENLEFFTKNILPKLK